MVRALDHEDLPSDAPLRDWITNALRAERNGDLAEDDGMMLRYYIESNPWPESQHIPPPEVANKGLGPLQFWNVFGMQSYS